MPIWVFVEFGIGNDNIQDRIVGTMHNHTATADFGRTKSALDRRRATRGIDFDWNPGYRDTSSNMLRLYLPVISMRDIDALQQLAIRRVDCTKLSA